MEKQSTKVNPLFNDAAGGGSESPDVPANAAPQEAPTSEISPAIDSLKLKADDDRHAYIMKRMEENRIKVAEITENLQKLSFERANHINGDKKDNLLTRRMKEAIDMQSRADISFRSSISSQEDDEYASVIHLGSDIAVKNSVRPIYLPKVEKLPSSATRMFMDRNQKMKEDQSVVGRGRTYYDQSGGDAPINDEVDSKEFVDSEDNIISQNAIESSKPGETDFNMSSLLDKDLEAAQAAFNYLFCRRCLIFDCKVHGRAQDLKFPAETRTSNDNGIAIEEDQKTPCGPKCYLQVQVPELKKEADESTCKEQVTDFQCWRTLEKGLFEKGLEIYGKNSCLIARNLLTGLKTCAEVSHALKCYKRS